MSKIERMTIVFPEPMAADIRAAVERGEYASTSEAVRDAVRLWKERQQLRERDVHAIRSAWAEGKASGVAGPYDMQAIMRGARAAAKPVKRTVAKIVITRRATEDFHRIWTYIAADSPRAADRPLGVIDRKIRLLELFPEMGPPRDDLQQDCACSSTAGISCSTSTSPTPTRWRSSLRWKGCGT